MVEDFSLPNAAEPAGPEPRRGWASWPAPAKWASGCGLGCLAAIVLQALFIGAVVTAWTAMVPPEGMEVRAEAPAQVVVGQKFPLTVVVRNTGAAPFTVTSVAVRKQTQELLTLADPQPKPVLKVSPFGVATTWGYQQVIEPGKSWTVRFDAVARKAGTLEGSVDVQSAGIRSGHFTIQAVEESRPGTPAPAPSPPKP